MNGKGQKDVRDVVARLLPFIICDTVIKHVLQVLSGDGQSSNADIQAYCNNKKTWIILIQVLAGLQGFEPWKCWSQSPVPYHLAIAQYYVFVTAFCALCCQQMILYQKENKMQAFFWKKFKITNWINLTNNLNEMYTSKSRVYTYK